MIRSETLKSGPPVQNRPRPLIKLASLMLVHSDKEQKLNLWKRLINSKEGTMESGLLNLKLM